MRQVAAAVLVTIALLLVVPSPYIVAAGLVTVAAMLVWRRPRS